MMHAYIAPFVSRAGGASFTGKTLVAKVTIDKGFSVYSFDPNNPQAPQQQGAYSIQFNIGAKLHWYQNTLIQDMQGGLFWHLQCFEGVSVSASGYVALPKDGQYFRSTDPAGLPGSTVPFGLQIPLTIDLRTGGYMLLFYVKDDGVDISLACEIRSLTPQVQGSSTAPILWHSGWVVVSDQIVQPDDIHPWPSGHWYDPILTGSLEFCGVGGGYKAQFSGVSPLIEFNTGAWDMPTLLGPGTPDMIAGGQYWNLDGTPGFDPVTQAAGGTAEHGNFTYPEIDRGADLLASGAPTRELSVNAHTAQTYAPETAELEWDVSGVTVGAQIQFGFIPHGVDPAPPGAGYFEADRQVADQDGMARGSVKLVPGPSHVFDGSSFDAYCFDTAIANPTGYSQPVVVNISDAIQFRATPS